MAFETAAEPLISAWDGSPSRVHSEITRFNHRLRDTGLFEDDALACLLDSHPRDELTVCTMRPNPPAEERWIAGEAWDLNGAEILQAVRTGHLWVSPRHVMTVNPVYGGLFKRLMSEFAEATGTTITNQDGAIILSSANMGIFFHVDPAETMLWHIRGHKTIRIYPPREDYVTETALEAILLKENLSDLPFRDEMEAECAAVAVAPGEGVAWPIHSPHRVLNGPDLNVSISIEYSTPRSILMNGVFYLNGRLRRQKIFKMAGLKPTSRGTPDALKPAYLLAAKALKTLAPLKSTVEANHARQFDVDLAAPNCIRWRDNRPAWAA
ncbi:MAG TPA: hypothetical protein VG839_08860 [Asticcacaulis sp.]|nr:hypothetical protein [Asticcacaulis sp.]